MGCVPEIFKIHLKLFEAGSQLNAAALSQSASSNALLIAKSALMMKKKIPSVSDNQHSVILSHM